MSRPLADLSGWVQSLMHSLGYQEMALLLFVQNIFSPLPSEFILPLAGALVGEGGSVLVVLILAATAGSLLYSLALWVPGRLLGEERVYRIVESYGRWLLLRTSDVEKAQWFLDRHGGKAVFFGRFLTGVRTVIPIPAGIAGMPLLSFSLYTVLGSGLWNALLISLGAVLRESWREIIGHLETFEYMGYACLAALVLWFVSIRLTGRSSAARDSDRHRETR